MEKITCPICENDKTFLFTNKKGFNLYKCIECKMLFLFPVPKSADVYDDSYFSGAEKGFGYVDYDIDKEPMIPVFNKYLDIINSLGKKKDRLLDIGAATGFFMNIAKKRGFEVHGVELSDFAAKQGREKGLDIVSGDLFTKKFSENSFDVVTMFDVLEHVGDPKTILEEVRRILNQGGLLVLSTPDAQSLWARLWGGNWQLIIPPEHIHYFSQKNLADYLSKSGFKVELNTKIGKSFTLQYILKMLYKWSNLKMFLTGPVLNKFLSKVSLPINLRDNFFLIARKNE